MHKTKTGFFARKYGEGENLLTIFKTPRIWGALLGEIFGTMLITILIMCTIGMFRVDYVPIFLMAALIGLYVMLVRVSGAQLNPLVTAGMMATRRMSAVRGLLYILAQFVGAWIGFLILNAFRLSGEYVSEFPALAEVTGESFWALALISLASAVILGFVFARSLVYAKKRPLTFAISVSSSIILVYLLTVIISQNYFGIADNIIFNPAATMMYGILPSNAADFGELMSLVGLTLAAYVALPLVGGVIGFYLSDLATSCHRAGSVVE